MARPPRLARFLIRLLATRERNESYLGDIEEMFAERTAAAGSRRSRLWYWKEALGALPELVRDSVSWEFSMLKNYIKTAFRALKRQRGYSLLNIIGLAAGLACALLIWLWVQDELGFDRFHRNAEKIFLVEQSYTRSNGSVAKSTWTAYPLAPALEAEIPELEAVTRVGDPGTLLIQAENRSFYETTLAAVDPAFLRIFTFPLVRGDSATALSRPLSIVISWDMADKYFPGQDPIGQVLTINKDFVFTVTAVMKNPPSNSTLRPRFLVPVDHMEDLRASREYWPNINRWDLGAFKTWVQLREPKKDAAVAAKIGDLIRRRTQWKPQPWALEPLLGMRFAESRAQVYLFSGLAFFVLLVACINFMNLATARAANRAKEIGLRKVVGASRKAIIAQFYGETFLTTILAVLAASAFFILLFPAFQKISGKEIELGAVFGWRFGLGLLTIVLLTGFLAGSYPALLLSAFHPAKTLRGGWRAGIRSASFRRILVVFQFALSALLLVGTGVISRQVDYLRTMKLGYEKEHLIFLSLRNDTAKTYPVLKTHLQSAPLVPGVTASFQLPMNNAMQEWGTTWEGKAPAARSYVYYDAVDYDFAETLGLEFAAGRPFSREFGSDAAGAFLVNERMVKQMGMASPSQALGKTLRSWGVTGPIVGVLKDYHFQSAASVIEPQVISLGQNKLQYAVFRLQSGRIEEGLAQIQAAWTKVNPGHPFEYRFFDEAFDAMYRADERLGSILALFSAMGVLIACLGLFGLASFTAVQRTKEIGIRKVLGASTPGIAILLGKEFLVWVALANIISWPAAFWMMNKWLEKFAFRPTFGWWLFLAVGLGTLALALATVGTKALRIASAKTADTLRYE